MKVIRRFLPLGIILFLLVAFLLGGSGSLLIAKKVIAFLILPIGILWITLLCLACWPGIGRRLRPVLVSIWVLYSLAGCPYVGVFLLRSLEKPYYPYETPAEPFDALVLLGGGTSLSPGGLPSVGNHGDRILKPAMWYLDGKVGTLITTGRSITEKGNDRLLSEETSKIWQGLGIPESAIVEVSEPRNTAEELEEVANLLKKHPEWTKVGLCSSASHLNRGLKEARKQGLDLVPAPTDFRSSPLAFSTMYFIPQGRGFRDVQTALWEWLGRLL